MSSEVVLLTKTKYTSDIIEWVKHYTECGFDHILIYDNDSFTDLTDLFKSNDKVTVKRINGWPNQLALYNEAYQNNDKYDWQFFCDDDEFLWFDKTKWNNINSFLNEIPKYVTQYGVYWQFMSSSKLEKERNDYTIPVTKYYTKTPNCEYKSHLKTFIRKDCVGSFVTPHYLYTLNSLRIITELGACTNPNEPFKVINPIDLPIKLFHYYLQSEKELRLKFTERLPDHIEEAYRNKNTIDKAAIDLKYDTECTQCKDWTK